MARTKGSKNRPALDKTADAIMASLRATIKAAAKQLAEAEVKRITSMALKGLTSK